VGSSVQEIVIHGMIGNIIMRHISYNGMYKLRKLTRCIPTDFVRVEKYEEASGSDKFNYVLMDYSYGAGGDETGISVEIAKEEFERISGILEICHRSKGEVLEKF